MKRKLHSVAALSVFGVLLGCAQIAPPSPKNQLAASRGPLEKMPVKVAAGSVATTGASGADVLFSVGRYQHSAGQLEQAALHYTQVLELDAHHVGSLNALAVIHAQAGRTDEALKLFIRAMQLSPKAAHIHNNMGYALMRAGRLDEAGVQLREAQALDPGSVQAAQNMALLAREEGKRAAMAAKPEPQPTAAAVPTGPALVAVSENVYELRMPAAQSNVVPAVQVAAQPVAQPVVIQSAMQVNVKAAIPVVADAAASAAEPRVTASLVTVSLKPELDPGWQKTVQAVKPAENLLKGVRLEVSNGAGVTQLARRTADRLAPTGVITARLTNAKPYRQVRTEIQFLAGQDLAAQALQARLPVTAKAVTSSELQRGVQIRLVLGHDVAGRAMAAWLDEKTVRVAQLSEVGGW